MTPELQSKVLIWRQKALEGTLTLEDQIEAVKALREGRLAASLASAKSTAKKKAAATPLNGDDLLEDL